MNMEIVTALMSFIGGLGMFIYGMQIMAQGMQQAAGTKTRKLLGMLTNNKLMGVLTGALITAVIQSSSATTVMVVGFVNARLMDLTQAASIIMGANIGTTMTGWLVSMSEWGALLKPDTFAPLLLAIGTAMLLFTKKEREKEAASILIGFGLLFIGLSAMSGAIKPYANSPIFYQAFTVIGSNPLLGVLVGLGVTAIIQSSSASMGILQTLALNGVVNWSSAVFIALGQNIGTCVTALISSVGTHRNAKRAAVIHLLFNVIGSLMMGVACWIFFKFNVQIAHSMVNSTSLAIFHTMFNVLTTLILLPFTNLLVKLSKDIIPDHAKSTKTLTKLDSRLLQTPSFALVALNHEIQKMGRYVLANVGYSRDTLLTKNNFEKLEENSKKIAIYDEELTSFLYEMNASSLTEAEQNEIRQLLLACSDLKRISDHCLDVMQLSEDELEETQFSEDAVEDINTISSMTEHALDYALKLQTDNQPVYYDKVVSYDQSISRMEIEMRDAHMKRLVEKKCSVPKGVAFLDAVHEYGAMARYAGRLAEYPAVSKTS